MTQLVSIITPCYNHEKYLDDYFNSILSQTYRNIELIFIDDESTDQSWEVVCKYRYQLENALQYVVLKREKNIGLIRGLKRLKRYVKGEYLCILESDDYYKPNKIEENVKFLNDNPGFGAVHSEIDFVYPDKIESNHWEIIEKQIPIGNIYNDLLWENFILTCSFCCRKKYFEEYSDFEKYRERGYKTADYPLFLDLSRNIKFGYINASLANYRIVDESISHPSSMEGVFKWKTMYYQTKLDYIEEYGAPKNIKKRALRQFYRNYFEYGYQMFKIDEFLKGYLGLKSLNSDKYDTWKNKIRAFSMKNKILWRPIIWIDIKIKNKYFEK